MAILNLLTNNHPYSAIFSEFQKFIGRQEIILGGFFLFILEVAATSTAQHAKLCWKEKGPIVLFFFFYYHLDLLKLLMWAIIRDVYLKLSGQQFLAWFEARRIQRKNGLLFQVQYSGGLAPSGMLILLWI